VSRIVTPPVSYESKAPSVLIQATEFQTIRFPVDDNDDDDDDDDNDSEIDHSFNFKWKVMSIHNLDDTRILSRYKLSGT